MLRGVLIVIIFVSLTGFTFPPACYVRNDDPVVDKAKIYEDHCPCKRKKNKKSKSNYYCKGFGLLVIPHGEIGNVLFTLLLLIEARRDKICLKDFRAGQTQMSRVMRKPTFLFPMWTDTNEVVQLQKMARDLKFRIKKVEGLYYQCSENKGADQLRGYRKADLRLCFRICKTLVFS